MSEFLGVSLILNTKKAKIFTYKLKGDAPMAIPKDLNPLSTTAQLAQTAFTLNMLQNQSIWSLFETTNSRIYEELKYRANSNCADRFLNAKGSHWSLIGPSLINPG